MEKYKTNEHISLISIRFFNGKFAGKGVWSLLQNPKETKMYGVVTEDSKSGAVRQMIETPEKTLLDEYNQYEPQVVAAFLKSKELADEKADSEKPGPKKTDTHPMEFGYFVIKKGNYGIKIESDPEKNK